MSKLLECVDTNVIIRFLTGDQKKQQLQAAKWFEEAEQGKRELVIVPLVVAEVCFVLESFYKKSRLEIADALEVLLSQRWMSVEDREILVALWPLYKKGHHFVDSYLAMWAQLRPGKVLSFDKKLMNISSYTESVKSRMPGKFKGKLTVPDDFNDES